MFSGYNKSICNIAAFKHHNLKYAILILNQISFSLPSEPAEYEGFLNFIKLLWPVEIPERKAVDAQ